MKLALVSQSIRRSFPVLVALLVLILITVIYFRFRNQDKEPTRTVKDPKTQNINIPFQSVSGKDEVFAKNYPVNLALLNLSIVDLTEKSSELAKKLSLPSQKSQISDIGLGSGELYRSDNAVLFVFARQIKYSKVYPEGKGELQSEQSLREKAVSFLKVIDTGTGLDFSRLSVTYIKIEGENSKAVSSLVEANMVKYDFFAFAGNYKIIPSVATINILPKGEIISVLYSPINATQNNQQITIIPPKKAFEILKSGGGSLIKVEGQTIDLSTAQNLGAVEITKNYLGYYYDPNKVTDEIQPFWVFEAKSRVFSDNAAETFIVPAAFSQP